MYSHIKKYTPYLFLLDPEDEINSGEVIAQDSLFEIMKNKIYRSKFKETILQTKCFSLTFVNIFFQTSKLFFYGFYMSINLYVFIKIGGKKQESEQFKLWDTNWKSG